MNNVECLIRLTAHNCKNEKEYSWLGPAMKFVGFKQLV